MTEVVRFYSNDGTTVLDLTAYQAYILRSRVGWTAPPVRVYSETLPNINGDKYIGSQVTKRTIGLSLLLPALGWDALQASLAVLSNAFVQGGYLESIVNGKTRRIFVVYSSGLEGIDTSQRIGMNMPLVISLQAMQPYWEDPAPQTDELLMVMAETGFQYPTSFPIFFGVQNLVASKTLTAGQIGSPLRVTSVGPWTSLYLRKKSTGEVMKLVYDLPVGQQISWTSDVRDPTAPRRVMLDTGQTVLNMTHILTSQSTFFDLDGGANELIVKVEGGSDTRLQFGWTIYDLAPG